MRNLFCGFFEAERGQVSARPIGIIDIETNGGEVNVDGIARVVFEEYVDGEQAGFVRIGFREFLFCARGIGIRVGGDGETFVGVFGGPCSG